MKRDDESGAGGGRKLGLRRFVRDRRGGVASEFGLLAIPFALLVFSTIESCISFAAQEMLANATDDVARLIRTGQVKAATMKADKGLLKKLICDRIEIVVPSGCPDLEVDLRAYNTFAEAAAMRVKFKDGDLDPNDLKVEPGTSMTKNMLRVFYRWPVISDIMASRVSTLPGNKTLHYASVTWQNEPFDD